MGKLSSKVQILEQMSETEASVLCWSVNEKLLLMMSGACLLSSNKIRIWEHVIAVAVCA